MESLAAAYLNWEMAVELNTNSDKRFHRKKISQREYSAGNTTPDPVQAEQHGEYVKKRVDFFQDFVQKLPHGFVLCETLLSPGHQSPDFRIIKVNTAFSSFADSAVGNLRGKNLREILPELAAACCFAVRHPDRASPAQKFRVHRQGPVQEYEAIVLLLEQRHTAVLLVDLTALAKEKQVLHAKLEQEHKADRHALEEQLAQRSLAFTALTKELDKKQQELVMHQKDLDRANKELIDSNDALSVLARHIDRKRDEFEKKIAHTICSQVIPLIEELQQDKIPKQSRIKLDVLTTYLRSMTPRVSRSRDIIVALSPMELRVATMVRKGFSSEESARILHLSPHTIKTHRRNIRRKLNIRNLQINLTTYLKYKLGSFEHSD